MSSGKEFHLFMTRDEKKYFLVSFVLGCDLVYDQTSRLRRSRPLGIKSETPKYGCPYGIRNIFVPKTIRSLEHSFPWWNFRSRDHSFLGTFVSWTVRSMELSFPGTFVSGTSAQAPAEDISAPAREAGGSVVGLPGRTASWQRRHCSASARVYMQWRS